MQNGKRPAGTGNPHPNLVPYDKFPTRTCDIFIASGNNGSAFAGLTGNTLYYNTTGGSAMWIGRFLEVIPILALAGALAGKKVVPAGAGTFRTDQPLFVGLLIGVVLIVGALTFFPALALGPILEQLQLAAGLLH